MPGMDPNVAIMRLKLIGFLFPKGFCAICRPDFINTRRQRNLKNIIAAALLARDVGRDFPAVNEEVNRTSATALIIRHIFNLHDQSGTFRSQCWRTRQQRRLHGATGGTAHTHNQQTIKQPHACRTGFLFHKGLLN